MKKHHELAEIMVEDGVLSLLVDGHALEKNLRSVSTLLKMATDEELAVFEISPSGYGIHWPRIDEDISIDGFLGIIHAPEHVKQSA